MTDTKHILIVEDYRLMRQVLKIFVQSISKKYLVEEALNGVHALQRLNNRKFDLLITDINMPDMSGVELTTIMKNEQPDLKVLAVSEHVDGKTVGAMLEAQVDGFVSKSVGDNELKVAVQTVLGGGSFFSSEITQAMVLSMRTSKDEVVNLSARELEVLHLLLQEYTNQEISDQLHISVRTVETHKYHLLQKTNAKNIVGLYRFAIKHDLFPDLSSD